MLKKKKGISSLDLILIVLVALAIFGFVNNFVLHKEAPLDILGGEETFKSIGPNPPIDGFTWTSGITKGFTAKGRIHFDIEIESEESVKIEVYRIENSEMIPLYKEWKYPSTPIYGVPKKAKAHPVIGKPGETLGTERYALVVRNTDNEKVLQRIRKWKKGKIDFTVQSASPDGKINMKLSWVNTSESLLSYGNSNKKLYILIDNIEVFVNGEKRNITNLKFRRNEWRNEWYDLSRANKIISLGPSVGYSERSVRISLDSGVGEGLQQTKIVFRDAYGNRVAVYEGSIAYV